MKLMTPQAMRQLDEKAIKEYDIPGILLMEHAAYALYKHLTSEFKKESIVIVCGPGNNGGDGFALARLLKSFDDASVKVLMLASSDQLTADGKVYYNICQNLKVNLIAINEENKQLAFDTLDEAKVIVDAIFGTGLTREITGIYKEVIASINEAKSYRLSVDIPSGIDGTTGKVMGICVKADYTITFAMPKLGLYRYPALLYTGEVEVADIGIPKPLMEKATTTTYSIEQEEMKSLLPQRPMRSHKGTYGKVLVIGGNLGMSGAVTLASLAAYKVGCGTVTACVPRAIVEIVEEKLTEVMTVGLPDTQGHFSKESAKQLEGLIPKYSVIAIGPGIGRGEAVVPLLTQVLISKQPCVIDADALYFINEVKELLPIRKHPTILTPHPSEMARISGLSVEEILDDPIKAAKTFATAYHVILVLKLERSIIADPSGNVYINRYGNSGLAKGGSGDVLTGVICGLLAQNLLGVDAAKLGCYVHAKAGDIAQKEYSEFCFLPSDLIHVFNKVFKEIL